VMVPVLWSNEIYHLFPPSATLIILQAMCASISINFYYNFFNKSLNERESEMEDVLPGVAEHKRIFQLSFRLVFEIKNINSLISCVALEK
jgi:uncharacterized membrane protein